MNFNTNINNKNDFKWNQRETRHKNQNEEGIGDLQDNLGQLNMWVMDLQRRREKGDERKNKIFERKILKEIMTDIF